MFNRSLAIVAPVQRVTEHVTVQHKNAPTHESVALLKEMEQAAANKIIDSIKVGDTAFECVVHVSQDMASGDRLYRAVFSLNGRKMAAEHRERWGALEDRGQAEMVALRDAIAKEIANHILTDSVSAFRRWRPTWQTP